MHGTTGGYKITTGKEDWPAVHLLALARNDGDPGRETVAMSGGHERGERRDVSGSREPW